MPWPLAVIPLFVAGSRSYSVLALIASEVPFYAGLAPEEIGDTGVRWQTRAQSGGFPDVGEGQTSGAPRDTAHSGIFDGAGLRTSVRARVALKERIRPGAAFLIEGTAADNANVLNGAETVEIEKL